MKFSFISILTFFSFLMTLVAFTTWTILHAAVLPKKAEKIQNLSSFLYLVFVLLSSWLPFFFLLCFRSPFFLASVLLSSWLQFFFLLGFRSSFFFVSSVSFNHIDHITCSWAAFFNLKQRLSFMMLSK